MPRKILIVDDVEINRRILRKMISDEYEALEADDGESALLLLRAEGAAISAVLLDIVMPGMDGYELLRQMQGDDTLKKIPVIVCTGQSDDSTEIKALSMGASDFVPKPYNTAVLKKRLGNLVKLTETSSRLDTATRDKLTGLPNREAFFAQAEELIAAREPGYYVFACIDIDNFKVINDQYGNMLGDRVLRRVADTLRDGFADMGGICGRIAADNFVALYPCAMLDSPLLQTVRQRTTTSDSDLPQVAIRAGRYIVNDLSLPISAIYDRASLAEASIKGRYDTTIAYYDESMRERVLREQEIVNEMDNALATNQFEAWFQPQYNHSSGALIGAEALVRWRRPDSGQLIPPGDFIPVFERNGFIYELDKFVWERCCALLRKWLDAGRKPLPVSVNVSRYDIFRNDFFDVITGLVKRYALPVEMLRLEITESAFAKDAGQIIAVVQRLIDHGFTVEIDDFGSGYSSLNTLKDVPADILKLDMKFLQDANRAGRGGNIVESIVRMAKWLGMPVIAEGVETKEQADFLKSIGCNYVQGYLYHKPMPVEQYEALCIGIDKEERLISLETVETLDSNAFWNPKSMDTLIFNSYVGGACIFEYHQGSVELLRANDKYARALTGGNALTLEQALKIDWEAHLDAENHDVFHGAIRRAIETRDEVTYELRLTDLPASPKVTYLRATIRVIASTGERYLIYCTNENLTAQREAEKKERVAAQRLQTIMDKVNSGITAVIVHDDGSTEFVMANDRYYQLLGYTRKQFDSEVEQSFSPIHPDDIGRVMREVERVNRTGETATVEFRAKRRDGREIWMLDTISLIRFADVEQPVQLSVFNDITAQHERDREAQEARDSERVLKLAARHSGRLIYRYDLATRTAYADTEDAAQRGALEMGAGLPEALIQRGTILGESVAEFRALFEKLHQGESEGGARVHVVDEKGRPRWLDMRYSLVPRGDGEAPVSAVISVQDITKNHERELAYDRYRQSIDSGCAEGGVLVFTEADVTADTLDTIGGAALPADSPKVGSRRMDMIRYAARNLIAPPERKRFVEFFSRERLITLYADGERSFSESWGVVLPNGRPGFLRSDTQLVQDPYTAHIKVYTKMYDVTEERFAALDMVRQAETDGMTGLYNKTTVEGLIRRRLQKADGSNCALLIADLDSLKSINDNNGHDQGDLAIRLIADTLRSQFRRTDIVGRIGGDEFIVFFDGGGNEAWLRSTMATFMRKLSAIHIGEGKNVPLRGSVGIATGIVGKDSYEELFKKADKALYHVKRNGKDNFAIYTPDMEDAAYQYTANPSASLWRTGFFDKEELDRLLAAVSEIYPLVISVNLTQNSYYMMQYGSFTTTACYDSGVFDQLILDGAQTFHPEDRASFVQAFSRESLLSAHARGEKLVSHQGRQLGDDGVYRMIRTDVIFVRTRGSDDVMEITLARELGGGARKGE